MELINTKAEKKSFFNRYKKTCLSLSITMASLIVMTPTYKAYEYQNETLNDSVAEDLVQNINTNIKIFHCTENKDMNRVCDFELVDGKMYHEVFTDSNDKEIKKFNLDYNFNEGKFSYSPTSAMNSLFENNKSQVNYLMSFDIKNLNDFIEKENIQKDLNTYNLWNKENDVK